MPKIPRTVWKKHRWDFDEEKREATCKRCGCVETFALVMRGARQRYLSTGFIAKGSRIAYDRAPKCRILPAGMRRVN